ncbi:MAG: hypothetical protein EPO31_06540 [Gammaproteobacteria bacterium]|nr:MAG: hypothetical protein EPO31_06540 [Gammaproteobacteria bacterium]
MDEITKDQRLCAIYVALHEGNNRIAHRIFDATVNECVNEMIEKIAGLAESHGAGPLAERIRCLREDREQRADDDGAVRHPG